MTPDALSLHRPLPGATARLVAFPHAGGSASAFRSLAAAFAPYGVELCPLQPPGRENRIDAPFHETAEATAAEFAAAIERLSPLPTAFLGHSLGGLVAYLTARRCAASSAAPSMLVASGSLSPVLRQGAGVDADLSPEAFRRKVVALGGVPERIGADPDLFALFEPPIRADFALAARYVHAPAAPLACPILVYSGSTDEAARPSAAGLWQSLTHHPLRRRIFEGGHFFLYKQPESIAARLVEDLGWR